MAVSLSCITTRGHATSLVAGEVDDSQPAAAIELHEGLAISSARARRTTVDIDPIAAQVVAGKWVMPRSGDSVMFPEGQSKKWEPVKAGGDGWFSGAALRGGYLATSFSAPEASVMMLEAAGHGMVYADGEPRAGDLYSTGYVQLPVRVRKGQNALLFQVGRGRLKARLTKPKAAAFFSTSGFDDPRPHRWRARSERGGRTGRERERKLAGRPGDNGPPRRWSGNPDRCACSRPSVNSQGCV